MSDNLFISQKSADLRPLAEARLQIKGKQAQDSEYHLETDLRRLQHELEVHQIELQMQDEALHEAQFACHDALEKITDLFDFAPTGYFNLASDGSILAVNLAGARLAGIERSRLLKRRIASLVSEKDRKDFDVYLQRVFRGGGKSTTEVEFSGGGMVPIQVQIEAVRSADGKEARATVIDITERYEAEMERTQLIANLQAALERVKVLSGLLPICAACKKIRDDEGYWNEVEDYISRNSEVVFSHGICPDCIKDVENNMEKNAKGIPD